MSQTGKFLNLKPHMTSWAVYNVNGPYTSANKIGTLAPSQFGGLSYKILEEKGGDVYIIQTDSYGKCAIWAPVDNDSSITISPVYANGNTSGGGGSTGNGKYLNLHSHMTSWGVYNVNGPYTSAYKIGSLAPSQFGGLSYSILEEKGSDVYIIQTDSFGRCAIWAPQDNDSSITTSPTYSNGNTSGGGIISGNGKYLNLHDHMSSWGVYNVNGPYTSAYKIGSLAPSQFGGLSYSILEEKGGDVYIIQTDSFGRCAIWAPRDNDSSITTSPTYSNGNISGGGTTPDGGGGGVIIPGGLKVFIDPGHGGTDPGAVGNGLNEKDIVLSISKKLGVLLNAKGVSVEYSRTTDIAVSLEGRPEKANNWGANLFVSIHANASDSTARGTECYTTFSADSKTKQLSKNVSTAISNKLGISNRGHKEEVWRVLRLSNMPAILIETAFIDNSIDANLLKTRQDDFANAIASQIFDYLNISNVDTQDLLKYAGNTGLFARSNIEFEIFNKKSPIQILSLIPYITIQGEISLTEKFVGPYKFIDLSASADSLSASFTKDLLSAGVTMGFAEENLRLSLQKLTLSTDVSDRLKYVIETELNGDVTITLESSFEYSDTRTVYQRAIVTIKPLYPTPSKVTIVAPLVSTTVVNVVDDYSTLFSVLAVGALIAAIAINPGAGVAVALTALYIAPKK